jgi:hypothetical protein
MQSLVFHLIQSLCINDSDQWFSVLGVVGPNDAQLEVFLDMVDKVEEIVFELS